jgi:hypothetical protein
MNTEPLIINIDWPYALGIIGALIGYAWHTGNRFGRIETSIEWVKEQLTKLEGRIDNAFGSASPVQLLSKGSEVLEKSGLKGYIDMHKDSLISHCSIKKGEANQYDIQERAFACFDGYDFGNFEEKLKEASFRFGMSLETVKRIGGIYFRDILLSEHGFTPDDLDKPNKA